ncbi:hypothetical protein [Arenimonas sp. SCN 70-307]|uniref:hypothetical protein n=1 Tax=Arenimonas sp. SCN 70-307 TaxID=1660089 RepID=UPI0025BC9D56|nr:hypothetical protein [Arenimonas sp. SCN 70-307]
MPTTYRDSFDAKIHRDAVKRARGSACYGALAAHFGTQSPTLLEMRVDGRQPYGEDGEKVASNKYNRWRQGKALPSDVTVAHVSQKSAGAVRLDCWRDLPLWELLAAECPPVPRLHRIIEQSHSVRHVLFLDGKPDRFGYNHAPLDRKNALGLRNLRSLDAFIALLALARKGEQLEHAPQHYLPALCAFDILPYVLSGNPALRYRWEGLFGCCKRIFWNMIYVTGQVGQFRLEEVQTRLRALEVEPGVPLPQLAGVRVKTLIPPIR